MLKAMLKFALVGFSGVGVNFAVYLSALSSGCSYLYAAAIAFAVAVTNNFIWNLAWTFKGRGKSKSIFTKYLSFCTISTANLGINLFLLRVLVETVNLDPRISQFTAVASVSVLNFLFNYYITFTETAQTNKEEEAAYEAGYHPHL